ncbi:hypothetical protein Pelo_3744 [Pelomyxa schiedti]|nr:hypothetical protein Pelo_3744 [Pelomyxa schiedti]
MIDHHQYVLVAIPCFGKLTHIVDAYNVVGAGGHWETPGCPCMDVLRSLTSVLMFFHQYRRRILSYVRANDRWPPAYGESWTTHSKGGCLIEKVTHRYMMLSSPSRNCSAVSNSSRFQRASVEVSWLWASTRSCCACPISTKLTTPLCG